MSQNDNRDCVLREAFDPDIFQPERVCTREYFHE